MNQSTYESRRNPVKPLLGAVAVAAAMATLGLAVVAPVALSAPQGAATTQLASAARPMEVAILPGTIQVVGKRAKLASAGNPYRPASYNVR